VIDYTRQDFTQSGQKYDLIVAVNGYQPIAAYRRALTPTGIYVMAGGTGAQLFQSLLLGPWMSRGGNKLGALTAKPDRKDLALVKEWIEAGKIKPVIDRCYPLRNLPEA